MDYYRRMDDLADSKSEVLGELSRLLKSAEVETTEKKNVSNDAALEQFFVLQAQIKADPKLLETFRGLKERFQTDEVYRTATDQLFVEAVEMMDLDEPEETV